MRNAIDSNKLLKLSLSGGMLIMSLSVAYYLIVFLPALGQKNAEFAKQKYETAQIDKYSKECHDEKNEVETYYKIMFNRCDSQACRNIMGENRTYSLENLDNNCIPQKLEGTWMQGIWNTHP